VNNNLQQQNLALLLKISNALQWLPKIIGKTIAIACFLLVLDIFIVVLLRYLFDTPSVMLQEAGMWMHSMIFMLGAAYTFSYDEHVRVDIFYRSNGPRYQAWVDILGSLILLLPLCGYLFVNSWQYVVSSWNISETSAEVGGLPALYILKSLLLVLPFLLSLQAVATIIKNIAVVFAETDLEQNQNQPQKKIEANL
jgi:TRAP-type mannitol/chloroaromatic compound transport system permease small subunit